MKKILTLFVICALSSAVFAQENQEQEKSFIVLTPEFLWQPVTVFDLNKPYKQSFEREVNLDFLKDLSFINLNMRDLVLPSRQDLCFMCADISNISYPTYMETFSIMNYKGSSNPIPFKFTLVADQ